MPSDARAAQAADLGARLREVRRDRGLSTRELARRVGCSASLISQIERGASAPSAGVLYRLASELDASLDYLFGVRSRPAGAAKAGTESAAGSAMVQRAGNRRCLDLDGGVRWERLTVASDPYVDFLEVSYAPCGAPDGAAPRALRHDGREYGVVLEGQLRADVGFDSYQLEPGDSIALDSSTPHAYRNLTDAPVRALWFIVHREPWRA